MSTLTSMLPLLMKNLVNLQLALNLLHQTLRINRPMLQNVNDGEQAISQSPSRSSREKEAIVVAAVAIIVVAKSTTLAARRWVSS